MDKLQCQRLCDRPATHYYRQGRWALLICSEHGYQLRGTRIYIIPPYRSRFRRLLLEFGIAPIHGTGS